MLLLLLRSTYVRTSGEIEQCCARGDSPGALEEDAEKKVGWGGEGIFRMTPEINLPISPTPPPASLFLSSPVKGRVEETWNVRTSFPPSLLLLS